MQCLQCGSQIPDDAAVCPQCGAESSSLSQPPDDAAREVYSLLAAANLARIRRAYEEATAKCIEVLRRFPNNASAHSLMGDIYADQTLLRDAVEWYKIALELDPASRADRAKLAALLSRMRLEPEGAAPRGSPFSRFLKGVGLSSPLAVGMAVTVVVLIVLLIFAVIYQGTRGGAARGPTAAASPIPARGTAAQASRPWTGGPLAAAPNLPAPPPKAEHLSAEDKVVTALRVAIAPTSPSTIVEWVGLDPRDSSITIAFQVGRQRSAADVKREVLKAAQQIARAAFRHDESYKSAVLRGRAALPEEAGAPPEVVFIGETELSALTRLPAEDPTPRDIAAAFTDVWWHPALRDITL